MSWYHLSISLIAPTLTNPAPKDCLPLSTIPLQSIEYLVEHVSTKKDISTLKGRSTRPSPTTVVDELIEIPEELKKKNQYIDLAIDIILINRVILLTSIDRSVKYRTVVPLDSHNKEELYRGLD